MVKSDSTIIKRAFEKLDRLGIKGSSSKFSDRADRKEEYKKRKIREAEQLALQAAEKWYECYPEVPNEVKRDLKVAVDRLKFYKGLYKP